MPLLYLELPSTLPCLGPRPALPGLPRGRPSPCTLLYLPAGPSAGRPVHPEKTSYKSRSSLLIIGGDKLLEQVLHSPLIKDLFFKEGAHQYGNMSVIFITQNLFTQGDEEYNSSNSSSNSISNTPDYMVFSRTPPELSLLI